MTETNEQVLQRISDQRAENLIKAHERIKELEAENAKMREALEVISNAKPWAITASDLLQDARDIAKRALIGETK